MKCKLQHCKFVYIQSYPSNYVTLKTTPIKTPYSSTFLELLCHPALVVSMLHCQDWLWPYKDLPSWGLAFLLGDLFRLHLRLAIRGLRVERLMVESFVLYLFVACSLMTSSLIFPISRTSSMVSSSTLLLSSFCYWWNNSLLFNSSLTSTRMMASLPYLSRSRVSFCV